MARFVLFLACLTLAACTSLVFQPYRPHLLDPAKLGIEAQDVYFEAADSVRLHGWLLPSAQPQIRGTVVFLHGNAENISTHVGSVYWLPRHGFNVFIFDYRGYGRSEGTPTLEGLHRDLDGALRTALGFEQARGKPLILFGQSLGGAVAITGVARSAYRGCIDALVIEGAFSSFRVVAREALGRFWLTWALQWPLSFTISDAYRPIDDIAKVSPIPLLIIHGTEDRVIAPHHAEDLFDAAGEPKILWTVPGAAHIGALVEEEHRQRFLRYLQELLAAGAGRGEECRNAATAMRPLRS